MRIFKTAWFSRAASKVRIADAELCQAVTQLMQGQGDDLGGGVFKKRLNNNMYRAVILAKGARHWVYEYLFAKQDRQNIKADELAAFRMLAKAYADMTDGQLTQLLRNKDLTEICHDDGQPEIQH